VGWQTIPGTGYHVFSSPNGKKPRVNRLESKHTNQRRFIGVAW